MKSKSAIVYYRLFNLLFSFGKVISEKNALENFIFHKVGGSKIVHYQFKP